MWDRMLHNRPELVKDKSNGDVACDSFHLYKEDVKLVKEIGVSISINCEQGKYFLISKFALKGN